MNGINLLPWRERRRRERRRRQLGALAATAAVTVLAVGLMALCTADDIDQTRRANEELTQAIAALDAQLAEADELRRGREAFAHHAAAVADLWTQRHVVVTILDALAEALVPGVHYTALARTGAAITLRGSAQSSERVSALMRNIRESALFTSPALKGVAAAQAGAERGAGATFELTFDLAAAER